MGYIKFNWSDYDNKDNFFVVAPDKFLEYLTGKKWTVEWQNSNYQLKDGEFSIEYWKSDKCKDGHFCMTKYGFNTLQNSLNVNDGKITSIRVFRIKKNY